MANEVLVNARNRPSRDQSAGDPRAQDQGWSVYALGDIRGIEKDAGPDDAANHEQRRIEQIQPALERSVVSAMRHELFRVRFAA